jgi:hypothetical protein
MDVLQLLEQKISSLVASVADLKAKNEQLIKEIANTRKENQKLSAENAKLAESNAQLMVKVENIEKRALEGNDQINELNQEKALTKRAVDNLLERLKSIDSLIEKQ